MESVNQESIITLIIQLMNQVEAIQKFSGEEKKTYVLKEINKILGAEVYERYYYLLSSIIDFICVISKNKGKTSPLININNARKKYCCL